MADTKQLLSVELGLDSGDFIEVPALFESGRARIPNCVNALVCDRHVVMPDPMAPELRGRDIFAEYIQRKLTEFGLCVHFIDNWEPYHVRGGELHCGTNAIRELSPSHNLPQANR